MPGRDLSVPQLRHGRRVRGLFLAAALASLTLLTIGIVIGSRITRQATAVGTPSAFPHTADADAIRPRAPRKERTPAGAVRAAVRSITAFDGDVLLEPVRLRAVVSRIASRDAGPQLIASFSEASAQTRSKLGADSVPKPVIVLRSVPAGYRVERFRRSEATVSVWYVGIVGSGATVQPQQSWRTQLVELVWESGMWKVRGFASSRGPTPPLSNSDPTDEPGDLFAAIPSFEEFDRAEP